MLSRSNALSIDDASIPAVQRAAIIGLGSEPSRLTDSTLSCPICGGENLHICGAGVEQSGVLTIIAGDGTHLVRGLDPHEYGSGTATIFACESGHVIAEMTRFRKGNVHRYFVEVPGLYADWTEIYENELSRR